MGWIGQAESVGLVIFVGVCFSGSAAAQTELPFVPEFELPCHPTETVMDVPPEDPSADPFGNGPWYVNEDASTAGTSICATLAPASLRP